MGLANIFEIPGPPRQLFWLTHINSETGDFDAHDFLPGMPLYSSPDMPQDILERALSAFKAAAAEHPPGSLATETDRDDYMEWLIADRSTVRDSTGTIIRRIHADGHVEDIAKYLAALI